MDKGQIQLEFEVPRGVSPWVSTGLFDILYVAIFILGLSYYGQWQRSCGLSALFVACLLFALACAFHYNSWLAVLVVGTLISYDLILANSQDRLHVLLG